MYSTDTPTLPWRPALRDTILIVAVQFMTGFVLAHLAVDFVTAAFRGVVIINFFAFLIVACINWRNRFEHLTLVTLMLWAATIPFAIWALAPNWIVPALSGLMFLLVLMAIAGTLSLVIVKRPPAPDLPPQPRLFGGADNHSSD